MTIIPRNKPWYYYLAWLALAVVVLYSGAFLALLCYWHSTGQVK
jgi:hypothetical protein